MKNYKYIVYLLILLAAVSQAIDKDLHNGLPLNSTSNQNSHEELHSKTDSSTLLSSDNKTMNVANLHPTDKSTNTSLPQHQLDGKMLSKPVDHENSTSIAKSMPKHEKVIIAEGGITVSSKYPLKNKANETNKNITTVNVVTPHPLSTLKTSDLALNRTSGVNDTQIHKRIHGRPGVSEFGVPPTTLNTSSNTATTVPHSTKKKPLFTMITGDKETKDSESFIESPTTGRDYVLPIVLIILSLPIVVYLIKIIYRRGTEFTERQQYHRMYLIDGMYNSR